MKKFLRIAAYLGLGLASLLIVAAVAVKLIVTPERVRSFIEKKAAAELRRDVKLGGISISLFSGITVSDFAMSEAPDFSQGTFIASEKFQVSPQLLPLFSKKIFVDQLTLVRPQARVIRFADGTFNFSSMISSATQTKPTTVPEKSLSPFAFLVSKIAIESGRLSFVDKSTAAASFDVQNLDVRLRNVSLVAPVSLETSFDVATASVAANVALDAEVNAVKALATIKKLTVKSGDSKISATGSVREITSQPSFDLAIAIEKIEPGLLAKFGLLSDAIQLKDPLVGDARLKGTASAVDIQQFQIKINRVALGGSGKYRSGKDAATYSFNVKSNTFPIEDLAATAPVIQGYGLSGNCVLTAVIASAPNGPDVKGNAQLQGVSMAYEGVSISGIGATVDFTLDNAVGKMTAQLVKHDHVSIQNLVLAWDLRNVADMSKIAGSMNLKTGGGKFENVQKAAPDSKITRLLLTPINVLQKLDKATKGTLGLPSFDTISFDEIVGDYRMKDGSMDVRRFALNGTGLSADMKGKVGLTGDQPLALKARVTLAPGLIGRTLNSFFKDDEGRTSITMDVKGTMAIPAVSVNKSETGKQILQGVREAIGEEKAQEIENLFKGLFKK